jgi:hypothetical protein
MPGLVVPISGPYTGSWDAFPLGTLSDDGYELSCTFGGQEVAETDAFGLTLVEAIYRGQNWRARLRGLEWKTGLLAALQGFGCQVPLASGILAPQLSNIGNRWSSFSLALVLTAILGNPPTTPTSLTATQAAVAPASQSLFNMTSKVRELPLEMILIPYSVTVGSITQNVPFTTT